MKTTLIRLILISLFLINLFCLNTTLKAQSKCDSTLIELVSVQDSALIFCENSYLELKQNFDLLTISHSELSDNYNNTLSILDKELNNVREQLKQSEKSHKRLLRRKTLFRSIAAGMLGYWVGILNK